MFSKVREFSVSHIWYISKTHKNNRQVKIQSSKITIARQETKKKKKIKISIKISRADVRHDDCKQHCPVECPSGSSTHNTTGFFFRGIRQSRPRSHLLKIHPGYHYYIYFFRLHSGSRSLRMRDERARGTTALNNGVLPATLALLNTIR